MRNEFEKPKLYRQPAEFQLVVSLNVAIALAVKLGVLGNLIKYFNR